MDCLKIIALTTLITLTGCTAMSEDTNPPTGSFIGPALGGAAGISAAALLGAPKPIMGIAGVAGAGLGYYFTTLRFASGGIIAAGGHVYNVGDVVIMDVPTDHLFEVNSADFLAGSNPILNSIASVLARYPDHNIFIAGNTSGFWTRRFEKNMSECRANQVASAMWSRGISDTDNLYENDSVERNKTPRRLIYVGYGNQFPIANTLHLNGMRVNSHIQIVASPSSAALHWDKTNKHFKHFENIGDTSVHLPPSQDYSQYNYAFSDDHLPSGANLDPTNAQPQVMSSIPPTQMSQPVPPSHEDTAVFSPRYNKSANIIQTSPGVTVKKHRGYKDEDLR